MTRRRVWSQGELSELFREWLEEASEVVWRRADADVRLNPEQVTDEIATEFDFRPTELDLSEMTRSEISARRFVMMDRGGFKRVPGQVFTVRIPFSGSPELLEYRASSSPRNAQDPRIRIIDQTVQMEVGQAVDRLTESAATEQVEDFIHNIQTFVTWANADAERFSVELRNIVRATVLGRKQLLDETAELDAALEIPLTPVSADRQVEIPVTRTTVRLEEINAQEPQSEFHLTDVIYEDVLRTLVSFGRAMERLPITARKFDEEGIRDIALFILNANYQGEAAGEVFNGAGKNDITLTYRNQNAFIGEFKFWPGPKKFTEAVDQLLSYTVWRDTKAALVLLIKDVRDTTAINGADTVIRSHRQFQAVQDAADPYARRDYMLASNSDPERHISVALLPVVIPDPKEKS
jgi:hypothetical protein